MKTITKLWIGIILLIILSPLGLILPQRLKAGPAWGEWAGDEIKEMLGAIPQGLDKLAGLWQAPIPDYAFKGWEEKGLLHLSFAYIISAVIGILAVAAVIYLGAKFLLKDEK